MQNALCTRGHYYKKITVDLLPASISVVGIRWRIINLVIIITAIIIIVVTPVRVIPAIVNRIIIWIVLINRRSTIPPLLRIINSPSRL